MKPKRREVRKPEKTPNRVIGRKPTLFSIGVDAENRFRQRKKK